MHCDGYLFYYSHNKDSRLPVDEALNRQIGSLVLTQNWLGYFFVSVQPSNFDPEQCSLSRLRSSSSKKLLRLIGACGVSSFSSCVPSFSGDDGVVVVTDGAPEELVVEGHLEDRPVPHGRLRRVPSRRQGSSLPTNFGQGW